MNPFEMVVVIIAIITVGRIIQTKMGGGRRFGPPGATLFPEEGDNRRLKDEVRMLKDRVAVLERLITDERKSRDLDREIEELRSRDA